MRQGLIALVIVVMVVVGIRQWNPTQAQETTTLPLVYTSDKSGSYGIYAVNQTEAILDSAANETDPALSPDGQSIAFVSDFDGDFDLYLIRIDGTGGRALTNNDFQERQPRWVSDTLIVYAAYVNNQWDLFQINIESGIVTQLTDDPAAEVGPDFSTEGSVSVPAGPDATVNADQINIRQSPGTGAAVVTSATQGQALTITGRLATNEWVQVVTANGTSGWAFASLLTINIDLNTVPILNVGVVNPPQPTNPPSATSTPRPAGTQSVN